MQSLKDLHGIKRLTNKIAKLILKRTNQVNDYLKKTARLVINYCLENKLGTLIVGVNEGWKIRINIGKVNNQNFVQVPFHALREKLVNSDINGSANIGRKSKANLFEKREVLEGQMARSNTIFYRVKNPHRLALG